MIYVAYAIMGVMACYILAVVYWSIRKPPNREDLKGPVSGWGTPED
ncbi:hypothetical protein ACVWYH_006348 [Bradyrhizobium sp. GM24.11]